MNLDASRIGILYTPSTPLFTKTVVSYVGTPYFQLTISGKIGIDDSITGMAIEAAGILVRIKDTDTTGANAVIYLAENYLDDDVGDPFAPGATIYIYNVRRPFPRYQRVAENQCVETGDGLNQLDGWVINNTTDAYSDSMRLRWQLEAVPGGCRVSLYANGAMTALVARGSLVGLNGIITLTERNGSGITGTVIVAYTADDTGEVRTGKTVQYLDFDISWEDLGATDNARSKASQGPVAIAKPGAVWCDVGDTVAFAGDESFATYNGWNAGARDPALLFDWEWWRYRTGYMGAPDSVAVNPNLTFNTAGFDYVKLCVTDSNGVEQCHYTKVWCGITPSEITKCSVNWRGQSGYSLDLEVRHIDAVPSFHVLNCAIAIVDLETKEVLWDGYIWPESVNYNFEKSTISFTAYSGLAFLGQLYQYPFRLMGQKGDPVQLFLDETVAGNFDMLTMYRGLYFLLRWHTNALEIMNVQAGAVAGNVLTDDRKIYVLDFVAGTVLQQVASWADSFRYRLYPHRRGGFSAILNPLYSSTIATAADDAVTYDLTDAQLCESITYELPNIVMSEVRQPFFWHDVALTFSEDIARCPSAPEPYGNPEETPTLLATENTTSKGIYTNYDEALIWCQRHMANANRARRYTITSKLKDVDVYDYQMIDIPDTPGSAIQRRISMEEQQWDFNASALNWNMTIIGRDWGTSYDSAIEDVPTPETPVVPPIIPDPDPPEVDGDGSHVAFACTEFNAGDNKYYIRVAVTENVRATPPVWELVSSTGLPAADATGAKRFVVACEFSQGGAQPYGLWLSIQSDPATYGGSAMYFNPDPYGSGTWSAVSAPVDWEFSFLQPSSVTHYANPVIPIPSPAADGEILLNIYCIADDPTEMIGFFVASGGITANGSCFRGVFTGAAASRVFKETLGWNAGIADNVMGGTGYTSGFSYYHVVTIPKGEGLGSGAPLTGYVIDPTLPMARHIPTWINDVTYGLRIIVPATGAGMYGHSGSRLVYGYVTEDAHLDDVTEGAETFEHWYGVKAAQCPTLPGTVAFKELTELWVAESYLATNTEVALFAGTTVQDHTCMFGGSTDNSPYIAMYSTDGLHKLEYLQLYSFTAGDVGSGTWQNKTGNLTTLIPGVLYNSAGFSDGAMAKAIASFWGDLSEI